MNYVKRLTLLSMAALGLTIFGSASAVNNMEGGPAVHQLNFQAPVLPISMFCTTG
jgi:CBS-domain-containing membrane protein